MIKAAASAENDVLMAEFNARNGEVLAELTENDGVKLYIFPKDVSRSSPKSRATWFWRSALSMISATDRRAG